MVTSRMLLVVVGNIERPRLEQLVQNTLGQLPRGTYTWSPPRAPAKPGKALVVRDVQLPTNYLLGFYAGPACARSRLSGAARRDRGAVGPLLHRNSVATKSLI